MKLEVTNLSKHFKDKIAVDKVSISMSNGIYGLLGANGCGKTTLMRVLCGLLEPDTGEVYFNGTNINDLDEVYRNVLGYLPQEYGYYPEFSSEDYLLYIAALKGIRPMCAKMKVKELLEIVSLYSVRKKKIKTFSGGMKRRLGIAQAVLNRPKVLILDEPTAGLDPKERIKFRKLINDLGEECIILLSTHIVSDIESIANQIVIMKEGKVVTQGGIEELLNQIDGNVWNCQVSAKKVKSLEENYNVTNIKTGTSEVELRIIAKDKPCENATIVKPVLEDVFVYYCKEEVSDDTDDEV